MSADFTVTLAPSNDRRAMLMSFAIANQQNASKSMLAPVSTFQLLYSSGIHFGGPCTCFTPPVTITAYMMAFPYLLTRRLGIMVMAGMGCKWTRLSALPCHCQNRDAVNLFIRK